jgi:hypothetical protein
VDNEIELISDGEGLAVIGEPTAVERFIESLGMSSDDAPRARSRALAVGSSITQAGSQVAEHSGRWVKLTKESAQHVQKYGLTDTKTSGIKYAMTGRAGASKKWLKLEAGPKAMASNPAMLANAGALMAQLAMQQQMDQIVDYLEIIDQKLDSVLRAQTNQVLARLDGVDLAVREAMTVRGTVGRVSEVTWSKVQNSAQAIHEVQGYALRQLKDLADTIEAKKVADLMKATQDAEADIQKWLLVLARCTELHDAVSILELDRVLDADPDELDRHRLGLQSARADRVAVLSEATELILSRVEAAIDMANRKVLLNPIQSPAVVKSGTNITSGVLEFHDVLQIESGRDSIEGRAWRDAAGERLAKARDSGVTGAATARRVGGAGVDSARSAGSRLAGRVADRLDPSRGNNEVED